MNTKFILEADLNLPKIYLDEINKEASETIGTHGPSPQDMQRMQQLMGEIMGSQRGHEDELSELGKEVILDFYGAILDGVKLDIKIVPPDDEEKKKMVKKMQTSEEEEDDFDSEFEVDPNFLGLDKDIDKRKLINNIMQGEAQNVHSMMYSVKDDVAEITGNDDLIDSYMEFLKINRKIDWDDRLNLADMVEQHPEMANAMETDWEEDEEEGSDGITPTIKARVLDFAMIIHETVKGIYELIAAGAIDPDPVRAAEIHKATDTVMDEKEDIKYGPFIARDIRNYVQGVLDKIPGASEVQNIREFIFGRMMAIPSDTFVDMITKIILKEKGPEKEIEKMIKSIQNELEDFRSGEYKRSEDASYVGADHQMLNQEDEEDEEDNELIRMFNEPSTQKKEITRTEEIPPQEKKKSFSGMGVNALNFELNKAIDTEDWETAKEIQELIERKSGSMNEEAEYVMPSLYTHNTTPIIVLYENAQQAKSILKKMNIPLDNPKYIALRDYLTTINSMGYLGVFTKWMFEQHDSQEQIELVAKMMKDNQFKIPDMSKYKNAEDLYDNLTLMLKDRKVKQATNAIPSFAKDAITPELIDVITQYSEFIPELKQWFKDDSKMRTRKEPEVMLKHVTSFLEGATAWDRDNITKKIKNSNTNPKIVYDTPECLVLEISTFKESCAVGTEDWCIVTSNSMFNNYVNSFTTQYFIFDFTKSYADSRSAIAITVDSGGKWSEFKDRYDKDIPRKYVDDLLASLN